MTVGTITKDVCIEDAPWGDGWIVLVRRKDGSVDFVSRNWNDYKDGFGDVQGEFWIGNEFMHELTNNGSTYTLRVDLTDFNGASRYAEYTSFQIGPESDGYRLAMAGYSGDAGDGFTSVLSSYGFPPANGAQFSTTHSCANSYKGGWWWTNCAYSKFTGYYGASHSAGLGNFWVPWQGPSVFLQYADMKVHIN